MRSVALLILACSMGCGGIFEDQRGLLFINIDPNQIPPGQTTDSSIVISGNVTRSPRLGGALTIVTVEGGAATAVDTTNAFNIFNITVSLKLNTTNELVMTASDDSDAVMTDPLRFIVDQVVLSSAISVGGRR